MKEEDESSMINDVFSAARLGNTQQLEALLKSNPMLVNTENNDGLTPLGFASHYGQLDTSRLLLQYGADVNALSHSKMNYIPSNTALHAAIAGERNIDVIKILLSNNANPNIFDSNGHTCLHTAAFHDDNIEIIHLLLEHGADVNAKEESGLTALDVANRKGNENVSAFLRQRMS